MLYLYVLCLSVLCTGQSFTFNTNSLRFGRTAAVPSGGLASASWLSVKRSSTSTQLWVSSQEEGEDEEEGDGGEDDSSSSSSSSSSPSLSSSSIRKAMENARKNEKSYSSPGAGLLTADEQSDAAYADLINTSMDQR